MFFADEIFAGPVQRSPNESSDAGFAIDQQDFFRELDHAKWVVSELNEHPMYRGAPSHVLPSRVHRQTPMSQSNQARDRVDEEGENDGVEPEGEPAVHECKAAHFARSDLDVRNLTGHTDDKSVVGKIKIIGRPFAGKNQAGGMSILFGIVAVAIK